LLQTAVSRAEVTSLDLEVGASHFGQVSAQIEEWVRLQEELVKDFIAVLLILVAATEDTIGSLDSKPKPLIAILFEDCAQLLVR